jgi:hypothetical protein
MVHSSLLYFSRDDVSKLYKVSVIMISTGPDKVKTVQDWPRPKTPKQMRGFLGLWSYYRKYVKKLCNHSQTVTNDHRYVPLVLALPGPFLIDVYNIIV